MPLLSSPSPRTDIANQSQHFFSLGTGGTLGSFSPWYNMRGATPWRSKSTWPLHKGFIVKIVENERDPPVVSAFVNSGSWCILGESSRERNMERNWNPPPSPCSHCQGRFPRRTSWPCHTTVVLGGHQPPVGARRGEAPLLREHSPSWPGLGELQIPQ